MSPASVKHVDPLVRWLSRIWLIPKREWLRRRVRSTVVERIRDSRFVVPPAVFNPVIFRTGAFFSEFIADSEYCDPARFEGRPRPSALDCTTGSGAQAVMLARRGFRVTAVDVNPEAVRAARGNAELNGVGDDIEVLHGDLFAPVAGRKFDVVVSALPFFLGAPSTLFESAWRSPDIIERFTNGLAGVMAPGGLGLAVFSTDGDQEAFLGGLERNAFEVEALAEKHLGSEIVTVYSIRSRIGSAACP